MTIPPDRTMSKGATRQEGGQQYTTLLHAVVPFYCSATHCRIMVRRQGSRTVFSIENNVNSCSGAAHAQYRHQSDTYPIIYVCSAANNRVPPGQPPNPPYWFAMISPVHLMVRVNVDMMVFGNGVSEGGWARGETTIDRPTSRHHYHSADVLFRANSKRRNLSVNVR